MKNKIIQSISAGMIISLGCWIYLSVENKILGALLFSCGLLAVRIYKLNLFTGKVQYLITNQYKWYDYFIFLIGNIIGAFIISLLCNISSETLAELKNSQLFTTALIKGIGCGALMSLGTHKQTPLWISSLCVLAFILAGFNHCIADAFYLFNAGYFLSIGWLGSLIGNIIGGILFSQIIRDEQ